MALEKHKTYIGVVEDNNDPKKLGRCKVRVMDVFDSLPVEDIPWAFPWKDLNGNGFNLPEKGKVVVVVFDQGNQNSPEYIYADHYNVNLENKLKSVSEKDYLSMKSVLFDHKTQIYVNDSEGLKIDHKYNNVNITENTIDFNLKDNNRNVNIGDASATQQAILGNHWMDWFDEFVDNLLGTNAGPFLGNLGAPVIPNPQFISCLLRYKALRDPVFLSHHVNIVDNNKVKTVSLAKREDDPLLGDEWTSTKEENNLSERVAEEFKPVDGPKKEFDDSPSATQVPNGATTSTVPDKPAASSTKSDPKLDKLIKFLDYKKYTVYGETNVLNIVAMRTKDDGSVTNKFDDTLYVFYKKDNGNWEILEYPVTTTPGFLPQTQEEKEAGSALVLPENVKILAFGQYTDQLSLETFGGDESVKCLKFENAAYYINDKRDKYNWRAKLEQSNKHTFTIRRANDLGTVESVFNYSNDGSQVFKNLTHFNQFISLCETQVKTKSKFSYTVCRKSEFDDYVPKKESEKAKTNNTQNNQQPKKQTGNEKLDVIKKRLNDSAIEKKLSNGDRVIEVYYNSHKNIITFYNNGRFATFDSAGGGYISKGSFDDGARVLNVTEGKKAGQTFKTSNFWETLTLYKK
jgi:hypothetical protein